MEFTPKSLILTSEGLTYQILASIYICLESFKKFLLWVGGGCLNVDLDFDFFSSKALEIKLPISDRN